MCILREALGDGVGNRLDAFPFGEIVSVLEKEGIIR
jgi:hypothetical protein